MDDSKMHREDSNAIKQTKLIELEVTQNPWSSNKKFNHFSLFFFPSLNEIKTRKLLLFQAVATYKPKTKAKQKESIDGEKTSK